MIYEFNCTECKIVKEVHSTMKEITTLKVMCDSCKQKMNRVYTIHLKGFDEIGRSGHR